MGTYNGTYPPLTEPFVFTVSNFEKSDDNHVRLSVYFSSVSKIACAANLSTIDPANMEFVENKQVRFYVRSKKQETHDFLLSYLPGVEQRVFCKISGLLYNPFHVEYYKSEPFYLSYAHMAIEDMKHENRVFSFRYTPEQVQWVSIAPWDTQRVLCTTVKISNDQEVEAIPESQIVYDSGLHFTWTILIEMEPNKNSFYCTWLTRRNSTWTVMQQDLFS